MGLDVVAEGVETAAQAKGLTKLKCEYAQGFHYAKPLTADQAGALLRAEQKR
jgi:EAL domain-containing protein (putative c-di-GMP-specific phosphodiesterase class I)